MENTSSKCNVIKQVKVKELLDDRYFFIPSYQRGYRWSKQQVYDLCNDLLEYALKENKTHGSFYSLQPLIVRKGIFCIDGVNRDAYEVIDGQQRLTTIFLLYRFLANKSRYPDMDTIAQDLGNKKLYHIFYETRQYDFHLLEKTGFNNLTYQDIRDIDMAHISNALYYMKCWLEGKQGNDPDCAEALCCLYGVEYNIHNVTRKLFDLLNGNDEERLGSIQFIWYEIDTTKDAIKEFLAENKGKIGLTDTEKIRALFMLRSNFENDIRNLKQLSIAKDWELIENTLHRNDFWSFISNDIFLEDGRIIIIFKYIFDNDTKTAGISQEGDYLFRYYYRHLTKKNKTAEGSVIVGSVESLWKQVMDCFRMLQNWFYNPKIYNLVGLLVKHGYSIKNISDIYNRDSINTHDDFIYELNKEIRNEIINSIPIRKGNAELDIREDEEYIHLFFDNSKEKAMIPDLLRFINIREMNKTIDCALSEIDIEDNEKKRSDLMRGARDVISHIYRFPFEALDVFGWDIEHIDSATTNSLSKPKEQQDWLLGAEEALGKELQNDEFYSKQKTNFKKSVEDDEKKEILNAMVNRVYDIIEEDNSKERKNWIGNLTLLDSGTNRSYKNKIFAWKKKILRERIRSGVFVPICTQNIFNKVIPGASHVDWKWSHEDKKAYHAYLLKEINEFKREFANKDTKIEIITS